MATTAHEGQIRGPTPEDVRIFFKDSRVSAELLKQFMMAFYDGVVEKGGTVGSFHYGRDSSDSQDYELG